MAIGDDFSAAVNGDIRHVSGTTTYTVLQFHRWLGELADDASAAGNDLIDITSETPADRSTDNIITLVDHSASGGPTYNIDDTAAEFLYDGSITQNGGKTVYSGLRVLGAVNDVNTQLMVIQNNKAYPFTTTPSAPFWGTQATGGYNGDSAQGILMRCLIKSRANGADINQKRIRVQARFWGDTYDFFNVQLGVGESVAAISTTPDAQNATTQGTVTAYTHVVNSGGTANAPTGGYQGIDLNNGNGVKYYGSKWTFGADTSGDGLKGMWEYIKDLTGTGTAKTLDGINGELYLGITHELAYDNQTAVDTFDEREILAWGMKVVYNTLAGGTFTAGNRVFFGTGSAGAQITYDNGTTEMYVILDSGATTPVNTEVITEYDDTGASGVTAAVNGAPTGSGGGTGLIIADSEAGSDGGTTGTTWIQLLTGSAPINNAPLIGATSAVTADVNGAPTARTVPKVFLGSYTGSLIGAYGIGVLSADLSASDTIQDLSNVTQTPPNNVVFSVTGLATAAGGDRVLVGPRSGSILNKAQMTLNTGLSGGAEVLIDVGTGNIPVNTPTTGNLRVELDTGVYRSIAYTANDGDDGFTVASSDWTDPNDAIATNNVFLAYIDKNAASGTETYQTVFTSAQNLFVRVRFGDSSGPIKTFESPAQLSASGGSIAAIRTTDA